MKHFIIALSMAALFSGVSGCATSAVTHEQDRAQHEAWLEQLYTKYDPEYIDDCFYYEDLVCEFE